MNPESYEKAQRVWQRAYRIARGSKVKIIRLPNISKNYIDLVGGSGDYYSLLGSVKIVHSVSYFCNGHTVTVDTCPPLIIDLVFPFYYLERAK